MPGLNYLESGPQDVYALNRLGSTFSDMVVGLQLNRIRQQQFLAQQAQEAARIQIERERQQSNELTERALRERYGAETDYRKAQLESEKYRLQSDKTQGEAGGILGDVTKGLIETDPSRNPDVANFLRAIGAQQTMRIAATNPQNIVHQFAQSQQLNDPMVRNLIATGAHSVMPVTRGGELFDVPSQRVLATNPYVDDPNRLAIMADRNRITEQGELGRTLGSLKRGGYNEDDPIFRKTQGKFDASLSARKVGQTVTTAKGTFRWMGDGWEPVGGQAPLNSRLGGVPNINYDQP